jgi:hypothetical protein
MAVVAAVIVGCNQQAATDVGAPPVAADSKSDSIPAAADAPEPDPTAPPTPLSTATPKPEPTATPTLIPTNTPTPEPPGVGDYENDRLAQVLSGDRSPPAWFESRGGTSNVWHNGYAACGPLCFDGRRILNRAQARRPGSDAASLRGV